MLFSNVKALVFWFLQICAPDPPPPPLDLSWGKGSVHRLCSLFCFSLLATLVTRGELAPKCVPHLLLGSSMEHASQPLAIFSLSLVTVPKSLPKLTRLSSCIYSFSFWFFLNFIFIAPLAPYVGEITDISASKTSAVIQLWPAEQRNGPIRYDQSLVFSLIDFRS